MTSNSPLYIYQDSIMFKQTSPPWKPVVFLGLGCLYCDLSSQRVTLLITTVESRSFEPLWKEKIGSNYLNVWKIGDKNYSVWQVKESKVWIEFLAISKNRGIKKSGFYCTYLTITNAVKTKWFSQFTLSAFIIVKATWSQKFKSAFQPQY